MKKSMIIGAVLIAAPLYAQPATVNGANPQLPATLGPNGGVKVECIAGTCTGGGGGGGGVVDQGLPGMTAWPVVFGNTTIGVTGTFWQNTQPVSGTFWPTTAAAPSSTRLSTGAAFYDGRDRNWTITETVPVSGTFWQATQPISGTVAVSNFPATQPVSGTFWQATQPVSGTFFQATQPVSIATMPSTPVTGTFFQATQPVSIAAVVATQEGGSTKFSCFVQAVTATTQCLAAPAAGQRAYITSFSASNQAATVQTLDIVFGTGAACVTGTTALTHKYQFGTVATTTSPFVVQQNFPTPLVPTAANAICVRPSAATAFGATITGYTAP